MGTDVLENCFNYAFQKILNLDLISYRHQFTPMVFWGGGEIMAIFFRTASRPFLAKCSVEKKTGSTLETKFKI